MVNVTRISSARYLPGEWDHLASDYFQTKEFLIYTEMHNPCQQRYYSFTQGNCMKAGAVVYTLRLNLFTYLSLSYPVKMNIVGIPCSVSACGVLGACDLISSVLHRLKTLEKGIFIVLNLNTTPQVKDMAITTTLPTIIFSNRFNSWNEYVTRLRADYRRRLQYLSRAFYEVKKQRSRCSAFNSEMYHQYREVLQRSKGKLETLTQSFFEHLPANFRLTSYYHQQELLGWYVSARFKEKYYFFLGGINYNLNRKYNTYFNLLFGLLREGIEGKASIIDLGQTAEIPKIRLGGKIVAKTMIGYHSNWVFRKMLLFSKNILGYRINFSEAHVFKK